MDEQLNIEHDSISMFRMGGAALDPEDRFVLGRGAPQPSTRPVTVRRFSLLLFMDMFNSIPAVCDRNEIIQVFGDRKTNPCGVRLGSSQPWNIVGEQENSRVTDDGGANSVSLFLFLIEVVPW